MRYHVKLNGTESVSFLEAFDALEYVASALRKDGALIPTIIDTAVGIPYDSAAVLEWCRKHDHDEG